MKVPHYPYRTGDPTHDNQARRWNRALHKQLRYFHVTTPGGRRRKKQITRIEGSRYLALVHHAVIYLATTRKDTTR